jgi:hypothetical protein
MVPSLAQTPAPNSRASAASKAKSKPKPKPTTAAQAQAAKAQAARHAAMMLLAPADEYFGPLKQSILGIRNTLRDMGLRYDANPASAPQTLSSAALTEASIRDWERKYPRDHGVPIAVLGLQRLYAKIDTEAGRAKAKATADWLFKAYGTSKQAKSLREIIAAEQAAPPSPAATPVLVPAAPDTVQSSGPFIPSSSPSPRP